MAPPCLYRGEGRAGDAAETDAIDLLASKLRTPLQMQRHLTLALEVGYQTGEQPISAGMVDTVLSQQFDDLEPTLTRHGYHITDLVPTIRRETDGNQSVVQ